MARYPAAWVLSLAASLGLVSSGSIALAGRIALASYEETADEPGLAADSGETSENDGEYAESDEPLQPTPADSSSSDDSAAADDNTSTPEEATPEEGQNEDAPADDAPSDEGSSDDADSGTPVDEGEVDVAPEPQASQDGNEPELITERYPNRALKIEREVTQDAGGNYINHGSWKMWDIKGNVTAEGQFQEGERHGTWNRWYRTGEVPLLTQAPYQQYAGPFISQATFNGGKIDGKWTIYDNKQRKISEWNFADGQRHGKSTWWFANGRKMREIDYRDGDIDGEMVEWDADGRVLIRDTYQEGRKLAPKVAYHTSSQKKSEGLYLHAKDVLTTPDDWWDAKLANYSKQGKDEKHGSWTAWYSSGQKLMQGEYKNDAQVGKFTWWHENGQKALEGSYDNGKQHGRWIWWYDNGQKSIQGDYVKGNPTGHWNWWKLDGKVAQSADLSHAEGKVVELPETPKDSPRAQQPTRSRFYR